MFPLLSYNLQISENGRAKLGGKMEGWIWYGMKIEIYNRSGLEKKSISGFLPDTSVIRITDVNEEPVKLVHHPRYLLELSFDDIHSKEDVFHDSRKFALNLYSREQAEQLADFVYQYKNETACLICQCRWGY